VAAPLQGRAQALRQAVEGVGQQEYAHSRATRALGLMLAPADVGIDAFT
jgi:hypothetical protein